MESSFMLIPILFSMFAWLYAARWVDRRYLEPRDPPF